MFERPRRRDRVVVQIDHPIELTHGDSHGARQLLEVERPPSSHDVPREVDRAQIADGRLACADVTSRISVQRLDRWTVSPAAAVWLQARLDLSLKVIHPLPVCARVRIMQHMLNEA